MLNLESVARPDAAYIRTMFDRMASRYDAFTFWMSLGGAGRLRAQALKELKPGDRVLDIACGTGDLSLEASKRVGPDGRVTGLDFSFGMLEVAELRRVKHPERFPAPVTWVCRGAETLPIEHPAGHEDTGSPEQFEWIVSGFALRGLYEHIDRILDGMRASLAPGGRISLLDLTEPRNPVFRSLYKTFFFSYVAFLGALMFGKNYPIAYLPDSSSRFLKADEFTAKLRSHGFQNVSSRSFILGSVTLYSASL
jgi:demethylmenaquinone methyltransferase/2-methoxy-6-polyprenyl-1,4-benzoquinol methylase